MIRTILCPIPQPTASQKNTKQELLDAYDEAMLLLARKDESSQTSLPLNIAQKPKPVEFQSPADIINKVGELKLGMNKVLSSLEADLTTQSEQLELIKNESQQHQKELAEVYKIKQTATTLQNIINLHQEQKTKLDQEIEAIQAKFNLERAELEKENKQFKVQFDRTRQREQEEYDYNLKLTRKKDQDNYDRDKESKIRELERREQLLKSAEQELENLRTSSLGFDLKLREEIQNSFENGKQEVKKDLEIAYNLE